MTLRAAVGIVAFAFGLASPAVGETLSLDCTGTGTYPETTTGTASGWNNGTYGTASGTSTRVVHLDATIRFELSDQGARVLMPPAMTPPLHNRTDNGWWLIDHLTVTDHAIDGRFSLNLFNQPRVHIDRMTGTIEVNGNFRYYFLGQCERVETAITPRF